MPKYRIPVMHEVYCDYLIEAESEAAALDRLHEVSDEGYELWTSYHNGETWGPCDHTLDNLGIECDMDAAWVSCPLAREYEVRRVHKWEAELEDDEG